MKHHYIIYIFLLIIGFGACQSDSSKNKEAAIPFDKIKLLHLLFFKKEQRLELWATDPNSDIFFLKSYKSVRCENTPIGIFQLNMDNIPLLVLEPPNEYYGREMMSNQFEDIFILGKITEETNRQSIVTSSENMESILKYLQPKVKTRALVFPNDIRSGGAFEACFGCPHRVAELYSSLELHLKQFKELTKENE